MERNSPLQEVASKRGWASALPCPLLAAQKMPEKGGQSWACMGQGAPWTTQGWSPLRCGCSCPVESVEVWVASDLQCKVQAAMEAAFLNNAVTWKAFLISSSSWPPLFSAEKISCVLLCALHHLGCSWQPHSQEEMDLPKPEFGFTLLWHLHGEQSPSWAPGTAMSNLISTLQPILFSSPSALYPLPWGTLPCRGSADGGDSVCSSLCLFTYFYFCIFFWAHTKVESITLILNPNHT